MPMPIPMPMPMPMPIEGFWIDLELLLTGLIMAAAVETPPDDFALWGRSWDLAAPAWGRRARSHGWLVVGMNWEHHERL